MAATKTNKAAMSGSKPVTCLHDVWEHLGSLASLPAEQLELLQQICRTMSAATTTCHRNSTFARSIVATYADFILERHHTGDDTGGRAAHSLLDSVLSDWRVLLQQEHD